MYINILPLFTPLQNFILFLFFFFKYKKRNKLKGGCLVLIYNMHIRMWFHEESSRKFCFLDVCSSPVHQVRA
jgi:hypothetical protein